MDDNVLPLYSSTNSKTKIKFVPTVDTKHFCSDILRAHNAFRQLHGTKALSLNATVTEHAQCWADQLASDDEMSANPDTKYGENIYTCNGFEPSGFHIVSAWYEENEHYDYGHPVFTNEASHFTNIMWDATRQLGVGIARSLSGNYYVVASYQPPGNVVGSFEQNVRPPKPKNAGQLPDTPPFGEKSCCEGKFNDFEQQCVDEHNALRARHYAPALRLDRALCKEAQKWAEQLAAGNEVGYMSRAPFGQNVDCLSASSVNSEGKPTSASNRPLARWYAESCKYCGRLTVETVHFTQMVWRSTAYLGVGVARSRTGDVYTVVNYFPPGNIEGAQEQNVKMRN